MQGCGRGGDPCRYQIPHWVQVWLKVLKTRWVRGQRGGDGAGQGKSAPRPNLLSSLVVSTVVLTLVHFTVYAIVMPKTSFKKSREEHEQEHDHACIRNCVFKLKVRFLKGSSSFFLGDKDQGRAWHHLGAVSGRRDYRGSGGTPARSSLDALRQGLRRKKGVYVFDFILLLFSLCALQNHKGLTVIRCPEL